VTGCSPSPACRPASGDRTRTSNAVERLHEEFKRRIKAQTVLPSPETAAMLFWALLASGQITMRKVDAGRRWPPNRPTRSFTSPSEPLTSTRRRRYRGISNHIPDSTQDGGDAASPQEPWI